MRYRSLDLLRGIAAIIVVFWHFNASGEIKPRLGYLAVDLFFIISGFALCEGYLYKLQSGALTPMDFIKGRCARLYPVYLLGLLLATVVPVLSSINRRSVDSIEQFALGLVTEIVMLPALTSADTRLFSGIGTYWSVFYELIASVFFAFVSYRVSVKTVIPIACIALVALTALDSFFGTQDVGFGRTLGDAVFALAVEAMKVVHPGPGCEAGFATP